MSILRSLVTCRCARVTLSSQHMLIWAPAVLNVVSATASLMPHSGRLCARSTTVRLFTGWRGLLVTILFILGRTVCHASRHHSIWVLLLMWISKLSGISTMSLLFLHPVVWEHIFGIKRSSTVPVQFFSFFRATNRVVSSEHSYSRIFLIISYTFHACATFSVHKLKF